MKHSELKDLAERADKSEGIKRERLINELIEKLPEVNPLEDVSIEALTTALEFSRRLDSTD